MLGELFNVGPASKKVASVYGNLINTFGSEFKLLLETPVSDIETASPMLARAVARVRENRVIRTPGFDGEFGVIRVFTEEERAGLGGQLSLFGVTPAKPRKKKSRKKAVFLSRKKESSRGGQGRSRCNPAQQAAVDSKAKTIVVQAGPGTGKTHTLVQRVKNLLARGQQPITVITFTNRAAAEIRQRLDLAATDRQQSDPVQVETFHGFCLSWLRRSNPALSLAGPEMRKQIFFQLYPQLSSMERRRLQQKTGLFLSSQTRLPEQPPAVDSEAGCYGDYYRYLRDHELLDLDEVVPACTALLADDPAFAEAVRAANRHLLVDEFQDLNAGQYQLVRQLAETGAVFAIGDPDQAIYGFRGATPAWFYRFVDEQQPELHYLTTNYRSRAVILQAAAKLIAHNHGTEQEKQRRETLAVTDKPGMIFLERLADSRQEAIFVADQVQQLLGGTSHREIDRLDGRISKGLALSDIGILYRTAHQAQAIADALAERTIPCQLVNLEPFYQAGDARIIYYWLLLAAGRIDPAELRFLFAREKGMGDRSLNLLEQVLLNKDRKMPAMEQLIVRRSDLPDRIRKKVDDFVALAERLLVTAEEKSVPAAIELLIGHYEMDEENPDLVRLLNLAGSAVSLPLFSDHLRKYQDSVVYDERAEAVLLATLHAAKGLEFKAVFLVGCEEGLLPVLARDGEPDTIEEERRLFYVGMTRAAEVLYLTAVKQRKGYKGMEEQKTSRFLDEIPAELLSEVSAENKKKKGRKSGVRQLSLF
jgi:superfamily I DNA/RNA helicase